MFLHRGERWREVCLFVLSVCISAGLRKKKTISPLSYIKLHVEQWQFSHKQEDKWNF